MSRLSFDEPSHHVEAIAIWLQVYEGGSAASLWNRP